MEQDNSGEFQGERLQNKKPTQENSATNLTDETSIVQDKKKSNRIGKAGFVISIIAIFVGWFPILGWIVWLLGFIFSFIGIFKRPKEMAISGLLISLIGSILIIVAFIKISTINIGICYDYTK